MGRSERFVSRRVRLDVGGDELAGVGRGTAQGHSPVVSAALECYRSDAPMDSTPRRIHGHQRDEEPLLAFAAYAESTLPQLRRAEDGSAHSLASADTGSNASVAQGRGGDKL